MKGVNLKQEKTIVERSNTLDALKGTLIILVVLGHTYNRFTTNFVYLFHVGLFFVLSGYCFSQKYSDSVGSLRELFKKRIQSLWIPYVAYNFIFLLLQNIWLKVGFLTSDESYFAFRPLLNDGFCLPITIAGAGKAIIKSFFFMNSRPFAGGLWFLGGLFYVVFLYAGIQFIMRKLKIEKLHIVLSIIFLIVGWIIVHLNLIEKIPILKYCAIILISEILFCIGTYIKEYVKIPEFPPPVYYAGAVLFFVILCVLSMFGSISIARAHITNPLFYITSILSGGGQLLCTIKIFQLMNAKAVSNFFAYVGRKTIPILALHPLCYKIITVVQWKIYGGDKIMLSMYPVWKNTVLWTIAYCFVSVLLPLIISSLLSKNRVFKFLFKC